MFTKRHYDTIAELLHKHKPNENNQFDPSGKIYWSDIVEEFTMLLRHDNPRFDEEKFRKACLEGK